MFQRYFIMPGFSMRKNNGTAWAFEVNKEKREKADHVLFPNHVMPTI